MYEKHENNKTDLELHTLQQNHHIIQHHRLPQQQGIYFYCFVQI